MANISASANNGLPTDFYSVAFKKSPPRQAYSLLIGRLKDAKATNDHLADYFRDRLVIEDQYLKALLKLSKRPSSPALQLNSGPLLGSFTQLLLQELIAIIDRHEAYQLKLHADVEQSIRTCSVLGTSSWASIKAIDDSLNGLVKTYEDCDQRAQKSRSKLAATTNPKKIPPLQARLSEDEQMLQQASHSWLQQANETFNSLQRCDHQRLLNLVESLTKFETIQADHAREQMDIAERSMAALLSFDAQEDMQRFAIAYGQLPEPQQHPHRHPRDSDLPTPVPSDRRQHVNEISSPPALSDSPPQLGSTHLANPPPNLPRSPPPGSLATYDPNHLDIPRLNTPNISVPARPPPADSSQQSQDMSLPSRALYVQRQSSLRSFKSLYPTDSSQDLTRSQPHPSAHQASSKPPSGGPSIAEKLLSKSRLANILARTSPSPSSGVAPPRRGSQPSERTSEDSFSRPMRSASLLGAGRGGGTSQDLYKLDGPVTRPASRISQLIPSAIHLGSRRKNSGSLAVAAPSGPVKLDTEGYSIPPEDRGRKPWVLETEGGDQTEVLSGSSEDAPGRLSGYSDWPTSAGLGGFAIAPPAAQVQSESEWQAAIARVQNTLSGATALGGPSRSNTALRGRRADGRGATVYENVEGGVRKTVEAVSEDGYISGKGSRNRESATNQMHLDPQDVQVMSCAHSAVGSPLSTVGFGNFGGSTVVVRVRERLDVLMDGGTVVKVMVLGEVDVRTAGGVGGLAIRLGGFEALEKVVPAPKLVEALGGGMYRLLGPTACEEEACVLKYRVLVDSRQGNGSGGRHVPLAVRPQWRTSKGKTEVVIGYACNEAWTQSGLLEQVKFTTVVYRPQADMVPCHNVFKEVLEQQSVPVGKWDGETNQLEWTVGEVHLGDGVEGGKGRVLGRFFHLGEGDEQSCGPVLVKFKAIGISVSGVEVEVVEEAATAAGGGDSHSVGRFKVGVWKEVETGTFWAR